MAFTEFYCNASTGSNMNGGSDENTSPSYASTNGGWEPSTGVFTTSSGDPSSSVTVGQFAHVFTDGSTTPTFIGRVTAVNSTTITVSKTAKSGTAPTTAGTGISINVGGVWKGPNGTSGFPFGFITASLLNASSEIARVNFKNNATYSITAAMTQSSAGPGYSFQGYSSTVGDGGKAIIEGPTTGSSFVLLAVTAQAIQFKDLIFQNNGATGSSNLVTCSQRTTLWENCVFNSGRGGAALGYAVRCEAYSLWQNGGSSGYSFATGVANSSFQYCIAQGGGTNAVGFMVTGVSGCDFIGCIADSTASHGFGSFFNYSPVLLRNCVAYNCGGSGIYNDTYSHFKIENCILSNNSAYGINYAGPNYILSSATIYNCAFYSNTSGQTNLSTTGTVVSGTVTLTGDPFVDAANGDFDLNSTAGAGAACRGTGIGTFTQTAASYSGTLSYPDIGASQHQESAGGIIGNGLLSGRLLG